MTNYFTTAELACPCCGVVMLMKGFLDKLNGLREVCGHPLSPTSVCRCKKHNLAVGGKDKSFHLIDAKELTGIYGACAADISTSGWLEEKRKAFIDRVKADKWSIGIGKTFIHIDRRIDYPQTGWARAAYWTYA